MVIVPAAPRPDGKATKIWLKLLGNPLESQKKTEKEKILDKRLRTEETGRNRNY